MAVRDVIQSAAGSAGDSKTYIEDVFSTYLYTGNGSTQTINNGIDLAGKGGMVWLKGRSGTNGTDYHYLTDTARGNGFSSATNVTDAQYTTPRISSFNSNGFSLGAYSTNAASTTYASWTFRKAPKFFDVVTWTGNGAGVRQISHSLGQAPGMIITKRTDSASYWNTYHRSLGAGYEISLNVADAASASSSWNDTAPTSSTFTVASIFNDVGRTYVAYLFAHDTTADGLIQCGSFTTDASGNATVNLGWEPQYTMLKCSTAVEGWILADSMRGSSYTSTNGLFANTAGAEFNNTPLAIPTATGFVSQNGQLLPSKTYVYMAIRRGPMRTPTDGTKVFSPITNSNATGAANTTGFPVDMQIQATRATTGGKFFADRLRGVSSTTTESGAYLLSTSTAAEASGGVTRLWDNTGFQTRSGVTGASMAYWNFKRAPGFFDVVCYTANGVDGQRITHNLGTIPELIIIKKRNVAGTPWAVWEKDLGTGVYGDKSVTLNDTTAAADNGWYSASKPTETTFGLGSFSTTNTNGATYVAYLFASCPGVSKVGSYTGNGTSQNIDCGFTNGARFVLVKCTSTTGNWLVFDTARGIIAAADPTLALNSTAAEASVDYIDPYSAGFAVTGTNTDVNGSGQTYIYLAIA